MEPYEYTEVTTNTRDSTRTIFLRQLLISGSVWTYYFVFGMTMGATTVFVPQIRREANTTEVITDDMASWINAVFAYSGVPWTFISAYLIVHFGNRLPLLVLSLTTLSASILFYCSTNLTHIFISEAMLSLIPASQIILLLPLVSEYTSAKYRGVFMTVKSATFFWGLWVSNAIGTFFYWKNIMLLQIICSIYPVITLYFWPESPFWLAKNGKFKECAAAHRWLKGFDEDSEKELKRLINDHREALINVEEHVSLRCKMTNTFSKMTGKEFYVPTLLSMLILGLYLFTGKLVFAVYAIDVIKKITNSESTAYVGMLILDGISVISSYVGCVLAKILKRKTLMLVCASIAIFFLLSISLYLHLVKISVIVENAYVSIFLLMSFSIAVCVGPMITCTSILGELLPLKNRILSICVISVFERTLNCLMLKVYPYIFKVYGLDVAFFSFATLSTISVVTMYLYLPETKDKTLQEIADCIKGINGRSFSNTTELLPRKTENDDYVR